MDLAASRYKALLQKEVQILEVIYENTVKQSGALERRDGKLLGKLLKQRQKYIGSIAGLGKLAAEFAAMEKDEGAVETKTAVRTLLQEIRRVNGLNIKKAESWKEEISSSMSLVKLGKKAIDNGYFKKMPYLYGYYVDKKIGK